MTTSFRFWCREKWYEYLSECEVYKQSPVLEPSDYFRKYKWWLKREFRHQAQ